MIKTVLSLSFSVVLGVTIAAGSYSVATAQEKSKETKLSERTVRVIMGTAFAGIPESMSKANGEVVKVDRSDPKKFLIPIEDARTIIISAVLSARADLCDLKDLGHKHFKTIMERENARKKWTESQMTYINVLHATTGLYMTGSTAVGEDVKKKDDPDSDFKKNYKCSDDERTNVKAAVEQDIKKLAQAQ